ncbi:MAG: PAS domain S-box protein, partial [Ekhidna sp.]|nr:PAS domain S-box protein [Ekhidna sp.]
MLALAEEKVQNLQKEQGDYEIEMKNLTSELDFAKEQIQQRSHEMDIMIGNAPIGICVTTPEGNFEQVNETYTQIYGYRKEELVGQSFTKVVKPEDIPFWNRKHSQFIAGQDETRGEFNVLDKHGKELHILADSARVIGKDGRPRKITYVVDLTERKRLEQETQESERQLRTLMDEQLLNAEKLMKAEKDLNRALEISNKKQGELDVMINNAPIGICVTAPDYTFDQINDSYCEIYGYTREELIGKSFTMVVEPNKVDWWKKKHDMFIAGQDETRGEFKVVHKNGKKLHILADSARIIGQDGQPRKITYVVDMTERKKLEQETQEAEVQMRKMIDEQLENTEKLIKAEKELSLALEISNKKQGELDVMINNAPIGICVTAPDYTFDQINDSYCEIYGYSREELIGESFTKVVRPQDVDWWKKKHDMFIAGQDETRGEFNVLHKNGKELHILADSARIMGHDGRPRKITYVVDMTERKKLEKETQEAEVQMRQMIDEQLENTEKLIIAEKQLNVALEVSKKKQGELDVMINNAPIGICVTAPDYTFDQINDSYCEIYGYTREELVGKSFTMVVRDQDVDWWKKKHDMFIAGQDETRGEFHVVHKNGKELHILADSARIMGQDGKPRKITYVVDMTERKKLEKETAEAEEQMRQMIDEQLENTERLMKAEKELQKALEESQNLSLVASKTDNAVVITDQHGSIQFVNAGFERITEYKAEEVMG